MSLTVGIVRSVPEMYAELDRHLATLGIVCDSIPPSRITDATYFEATGHHLLLVIPMTCLEEAPSPEWMKALEEAAAQVNTRVMWIVAETEKAHFQSDFPNAVTIEEFPAVLQKLGSDLSMDFSATQSFQRNTEGAAAESPTAGALLNRFRKWVESELASSPGTDLEKRQEAREPYDSGRSAPQESRVSTSPPREIVRERSKMPDTKDSEILRDYIRIKEDELHDLKTQITVYEGENQKLLKEIEFLKNEKNIFERKVDTLRGRLLFLEEENETLRKQKAQELDSLRAEYKNKVERLAIVENAMREQELKFDDLRERVRRDLFSIQERERYLEARMEVLKRDTEILLHHKDEKIVELVETIRQLEFKIETYQEALQSSKDQDQQDRDRSKRIVRALRLATSLLDQEESQGRDGDIRKREA